MAEDLPGTDFIQREAPVVSPDGGSTLALKETRGRRKLDVGKEKGIVPRARPPVKSQDPGCCGPSLPTEPCPDCRRGLRNGRTILAEKMPRVIHRPEKRRPVTPRRRGANGA